MGMGVGSDVGRVGGVEWGGVGGQAKVGGAHNSIQVKCLRRVGVQIPGRHQPTMKSSIQSTPTINNVLYLIKPTMKDVLYPK